MNEQSICDTVGFGSFWVSLFTVVRSVRCVGCCSSVFNFVGYAMKTRLRRPDKCKKTGKTKFKNEKLAGRAMMRIWSHDTSANIYDLHTYKCEYCACWHVGHRSYYEKKLEQEKIHEPAQPQINQNS